VQFAAAMGCEVTAIDRNPDKEQECRKLGAKHFVTFTSDTAMQCAGQYDIILNT
jgi:D-arabinose 1-dehydrogenase-like Zn-dependent alcohol dehydrogenase